MSRVRRARRVAGLETEQGACYFNGEAFRLGEYVQSGGEVLLCSGRDVWVREGEKPPLRSAEISRPREGAGTTICR